MIDPEFSNAPPKKPEGPQSYWVNALKGFLIAHCVALVLTASAPLYPRFYQIVGYPPPRVSEPYPLMVATVLGFEVGFFVLTPATLIAVLMASRMPDRMSFRSGELPLVVATSLGLLAFQIYIVLPSVQ